MAFNVRLAIGWLMIGRISFKPGFMVGKLDRIRNSKKIECNAGASKSSVCMIFFGVPLYKIENSITERLEEKTGTANLLFLATLSRTVWILRRWTINVRGSNSGMLIFLA
jgi:hypothetical protein